MAAELARKGATLVLCARRPVRLGEAAEAIRAAGGDKVDAVEACGRIDVLVNSVGGSTEAR